MRPKLYTDVKTQSDIIDDYFENEAFMGEGDNKVFAPTMSGLAYKLDMDRKSLLNYSKEEKFLPTIKRARERVHQALEQRLYGNNVTGIIFNLKNNFGWKDVKAQEIQLEASIESREIKITAEMGQDEATRLYQELLND